MAAGSVGVPIKARDIEIHAVANGFLVMPSRIGQYGEAIEYSAFHVFPTPSALAAWIERRYGEAE